MMVRDLLMKILPIKTVLSIPAKMYILCIIYQDTTRRSTASGTGLHIKCCKACA